jgi:hypothetical protein
MVLNEGKNGMKRTVILLATAGLALAIVACSEGGGGNNLAGDNALAIDSNVLTNAAGDISPLNGSSDIPAVRKAPSGNSEPAEQTRPAAPDRIPVAPASQPEPTPKAPADRPARTERTVPRPTPKQEPSAPPATTCTPEHEAMGHCKQ